MSEIKFEVTLSPEVKESIKTLEDKYKVTLEEVTKDRDALKRISNADSNTLMFLRTDLEESNTKVNAYNEAFEEFLTEIENIRNAVNMMEDKLLSLKSMSGWTASNGGC